MQGEPERGELLFCPFCREPHEGLTHCPEHELRLVAYFDLPRQARPEREVEALPWYSLRMGRGPVATGALLCLLVFIVAPLAVVEEPVRMAGSMLRLALTSTPKLWLVPAAALSQLAILYRRRTPAQLRGARVAVPLLALVPAAVVLWTYAGVVAAVERLAQRTAETLEPSLALGSYLIFAASLSMLAGGLTLGVIKRDRIFVIKA